MHHITEVDQWHFEVVCVKARRAKAGDPYSARVDITIVDGECHIEGAISKTPITLSDRKEIERFIKQLGFTEYFSSAIDNGVRTIKRTSIKHTDNKNKNSTQQTH